MDFKVFLSFIMFFLLPFDSYCQIDSDLLKKNTWKLIHNYIYNSSNIPTSLYNLSVENAKGSVYDMRTQILVPDLTFSNLGDKLRYVYYYKDDTVSIIDTSKNILYCKNNCLIIYYFLNNGNIVDSEKNKLITIVFDVYILINKKEVEISLFKDNHYIVPFVKNVCTKLNIPFNVLE